jgi:adenylosuccinate synthase
MKKNNLTILGLQWGDEGKGKVVDYFAGDVDIVARFGGGANAGHTVVTDQGKFVLHLLPSGIIHPRVKCYMGGGMVCDPAALFAEIKEIEAAGLDWRDRLLIDFTTQLVLPQHKACEKYSEELDKAGSLDTTLRGIGPAYADRADRIGIIASDLLDEKHLPEKVKNLICKRQSRLQLLEDKSLLDPDWLVDYLRSFADRIAPLLTDVTAELRAAMSRQQRILFEGAQGSLLDIGLGTYPYVTSSNTSVGGLFAGLGLPPGAQGDVLGVVKAYTTRVGNGPFPSELPDKTGEKLRERGGEYGATTGRPRRTGWLDLAIVKRTAYMSGVAGIVITKLDVLDGLTEIKVCVGHRHQGKTYDFPPLYGEFMKRVEPVYETLEGWSQPTADLDDYKALPPAAKNYISFIENKLEVPVRFISTGSKRSAVIKIN